MSDESNRCQYCGQEAKCVSGNEVYPHLPNLHRKWFWVCVPCNARVGCHGTSRVPLGDLADQETRQWRMKAHAAFDRIWKSGDLSRQHAYELLANCLKLSRDECHIGKFSVADCIRVIQACQEVEVRR